MRKRFSVGLGKALALSVLGTAVMAGAAYADNKKHVAGAEKIECTLIVDHATGQPLVRRGACDLRLSPASSFKLPLAAMGFDSGVLKSAHEPLWQYDVKYDAPKRNQKAVDPTIWEDESVLWYSRVLVSKLGAAQFASYVKSFGYGNEDVSGDAGKNNGMTHAWLRSSLKISADEQAQFVRRLLKDELPISAEASALTKSIIPHFEPDGWSVQGKTGTTFAQKANGKADPTRQIGWFVGWAQKGGRQVVFVRVAAQPTIKQMAGQSQRDVLFSELARLPN